MSRPGDPAEADPFRNPFTGDMSAMENRDRQAIEGLFARLGQIEQQAGPRDAGAEAFIRDQIGRQPGAPYFMAQTIVMQDMALRQAEARISDLEQRAAVLERQAVPAGGGGGLFGGLFGGGRPAQPAAPRGAAAGGFGQPGGYPQGGMPQNAVPPGSMGAGNMGAGNMGAGPWGGRPAGGGGFLAGAAQTAMGVAGGMLLGNMLAGMLTGDSAQAAEPSAADAGSEASVDESTAADEGGGFFDGWFGGGEEEL